MRWVARTALVAFIGAFVGVVLGRSFLDHPYAFHNDIHAFVHDQLSLDSGQKEKFEEIERQFAARREAIEAELRERNVRLAEAIAAEKGAGSRVNAAVDRSHETMGRWQKEALADVFAMRRILRPDQTQKFDQAVARALTQDHRGP